MKFNPDDAVNLMPDGEYDAEIADAEEARSKNGNDMMKLTVRVFPGGGPRLLFDYAVVPSTLYKLKQLAGAVGLADKFAKGELQPEDIKGKSVRVTIGTEPAKNGFEPKNKVTRYLPQEAGHVAPPAASRRAPVADDDIPF